MVCIGHRTNNKGGVAGLWHCGYCVPGWWMVKLKVKKIIIQKWLLFTEVNFKGESLNYKLSPALKNVVLMNQAMWHKSLVRQVNAAPQCSHSSDKYKLLRYSPVIRRPPGWTTHPHTSPLIDKSLALWCFDGSPGAHWLPSSLWKLLIGSQLKAVLLQNN